MKSVELAAKLNISQFLAEILISRGYSDADSAYAFLHPSLDALTPLCEIPHLADAAEIIVKRVGEGKRILVYGDYDCDGICAVAILVGYLRSIGANVAYYIPHRLKDGYGLSAHTVQRVLDLRPELLITVDCGISSAAEIAQLTARGIEVIVTDHHIMPEILPDCLFVNAKTSVNVATHEICGAALALRLVEQMGGKAMLDKYVDIAGLATIADVVPLDADNRIIVSEFLRRINSGRRRMGLDLLLKKANKGSLGITAKDFAFSIIPMINSAGRIDDANGVPELFLSDDYFLLDVLTKKLVDMNAQRKQLCDLIYKQAVEKLRDYEVFNKRIIMLSDSRWDVRLVGITAAKISEEFSRPCLLFADCGDGTLRGSGRSVDGIDIYDALARFRDRYITFGGHKGACGMIINASDLGHLEQEINAYLTDKYSPVDFLPQYRYDADLPIDFDDRMMDELSLLEPCGNGNPQPIFRYKGALDTKRLSDGSHLRAELDSGVSLIMFNMGIRDSQFRLCPSSEYYFELQREEYRGKVNIKGFVNDTRLLQVDERMDDYFYCVYAGQAMLADCPAVSRVRTISSMKEAAAVCGRNHFGTLYVSYRSSSVDGLIRALQRSGKGDYLFAIDCFDSWVGNPFNAVVMAPCKSFDYSLYRNVVFLERPYSNAFVNKIASDFTGDIFVLDSPLQYEVININHRIVDMVYEKLSYFIMGGNKALDIFALYDATCRNNMDVRTFVITFYLLLKNKVFRWSKDTLSALDAYDFNKLSIEGFRDFVQLTEEA